MKKIKVNLSQQSIENAISQLQKEKERLKKQIIPLFFEKCAFYFEKKANEYVNNLDIGEVVKKEIKESWFYKIDDEKNTCLIVNNQLHAVYVEFGVGVVGEKYPHPNASETDYKYDLDSDAKREDRSWVFFTEEQWLDLPKKDLVYTATYTDKDKRKNPRDRLLVVTFGTQGAMYAYNALLDLKAEIPKLWKETKKIYWG